MDRWLRTSHSPALLNLFISSDASICSTIAFPPLENSDHIAVSVSTDFPWYSQWDTPFRGIAYDYSRADRDGLREHLRDVQWEDIFKLRASAAASEFCERVPVRIDCIYPSSKVLGQASLNSMVFSCLCLTEFHVRYLALFLLFSIKEVFKWFWMKSLQKNTQLIWSSSRLHSWSYTFPTIH